MRGAVHELRLVYPVGQINTNTFLGTVSKNDTGWELAPRASRVIGEARERASQPQAIVSSAAPPPCPRSAPLTLGDRRGR